MTFLCVLHAESLKMKRTIALAMVVIIPFAIGVLILFEAAQAPFSVLRMRSPGGNQWMVLTNLNLLIWAALMLPLFITLETALMAGLDHAENQWKNLFARPVPRWTFYVAKLLVVVTMTAASTALLLCGVLAAGAILPLLPLSIKVQFGFPVPLAEMLRRGAQIAGLAFLMLTIQHWVSLRWRAFSVAIGVGIMATVASILMRAASVQSGGWEQYFPWSLPMLVVATPPAQNIGAALWIGGAAGLAVAAAGCWDFCRREVK
jgi:hypothetical protein